MFILNSVLISFFLTSFYILPFDSFITNLNSNHGLEFLAQHEVEIHENEMNINMTAYIVGHAGAMFDRFDDTQRVASEIASFMEREYNGSNWQVIIGNKQLSFKIAHLVGSYIRFSFKEHMLIAFRLVSK